MSSEEEKTPASSAMETPPVKQNREKPEVGSILDKMCVALSNAPAGLTRPELVEAGIKNGVRKTARAEKKIEETTPGLGLIASDRVEGVSGYTFRLTEEGKRLYPVADAKKELYDTPESPELEPKSMPDLNLILYGPPGTGKTYDTIRRAVEICDGQVPDSREELVRRYKKLCGENRVAFVTFHQSYGYEDFVEGIRPVLEDEEPSEMSEDTNAIQYECRPGIFKKICSLAKSATDDSPRNHVLIIDEVNRGNISKILGELITLLEPDKRLGADNELQVMLPYSGELFGVPSNVYVIGTMNTADRSIAFLDVALRRRFRFIEMMPETDLITDLVGEEGVVAGVDVAKLLETINDRIELLFDRDHQIGHSFFLGIETLLDLRDVFCHKVIPLLQEYFYGDWEKVCLILGCPIAIAGNATPKNQYPIIKSRVLKVEALIGESDSLLEDKVCCEIDPKFATSSSKSELLPYFKRVVPIPGFGS